MRHPKLVTPAVLLMCSEDAPNGKIIQAGNGRFSTAAVFNNDDLSLDRTLPTRTGRPEGSAIGHEHGSGRLTSCASGWKLGRSRARTA